MDGGEKNRRKEEERDRRTKGQKNRWTDRHDEANGCFCNFANEPEKHTHKNISLVNTTSLSEQTTSTSLHAFSELLCKV
jgi:hypothetical protein